MADTLVTDDKKVEDKSLSSAIDKALEVHKPEVKDDTESDDKTEKVEDKTDDKKEDDKFLGLSEQEQEQARQLFAALKDPDKAPAVLDYIASQNGYTKKLAEAETPKEIKEVKRDLTSLLTEALDSNGAGLGALAKLIAPVIDKFVDEKLKENTDDIRKTLAKDEESKLTTAAAAKEKALAQDFFKKDEMPKEVLTDMNKMMDRISPSKDMSVEDYIETIFYAVAGKRGLTKGTVATQEKINKNRNDAPSRLASGTSHAPIEGVNGSKNMSLQQSIEAAMEAAAKQ